MKKYFWAVWWIIVNPTLHGGNVSSKLQQRAWDSRPLDLSRNDLIQKAIAAGQTGGDVPAHLPLLAAAWMSRARNTFQEKAQKIKSPNDRALHWAAVMYTVFELLTIDEVCSDAVQEAIRDANWDPRVLSWAWLGWRWGWGWHWDSYTLWGWGIMHTEHGYVRKNSRSFATYAVKRTIREDSTWRSARKAVQRAAKNVSSLEDSWNASWDNAWDNAWNAAKNISWGDARDIARDIAKDEIRKAASAWKASDPQQAKTPWKTGVAAYRLAETVLLLTLISQEADLPGIVYENATRILHERGVTPSVLLREGPLATEQHFKTWKDRSFSNIQGDESKYAFVRDLVDELEAIGKPFWEGHTYPPPNLPKLPDDVWGTIAQKMAKEGRLASLSSLAQTNTETRALLDERGLVIHAASPEQVVNFFNKYARDWKSFGHEQNDFSREAIEAGKDQNREPAHLPLLAAAWMTRARNTFEKKAQKINSRNDRALHWLAVLYTTICLLEKSSKLCCETANCGLSYIAANPGKVDTDAAIKIAVETAINAACITPGRFTDHGWQIHDDPIVAVARNTSRGAVPWRGAWNRAWHRATGAAIAAATKAAAESESADVIRAVAYRSAETAMMLTLIFQEADLSEILYDKIANNLKKEEDKVHPLSAMLLRNQPLDSEEHFNSWKQEFFGEIQDDESTYWFMRNLVEELEVIAKPLWEIAG